MYFISPISGGGGVDNILYIYIYTIMIFFIKKIFYMYMDSVTKEFRDLCKTIGIIRVIIEFMVSKQKY